MTNEKRKTLFRWWYLVFLLLPLLYFGGRWFVDQKIQGAIAQANEQENELTLQDYSFGFFPPHLEVLGAKFSQDRPRLRAQGKLEQLSVSGVNLLSLLGDGPIKLKSFRLAGLDASLTANETEQTSEQDGPAVVVEQIRIERVNLRLADETSGQRLTTTNLHLGINAFQTPFQLAGTRVQGFKADSLVFSAPTGTDIILAGAAAQGVTTEQEEGIFSLDSLRFARVSGRYVLPETTQENSKDSTQFFLGYLSLPAVDLTVSGPFGRASFTGSTLARRLSLAEQISLGELETTGDSLTFAGSNGSTFSAGRMTLEQKDLTFPLGNQTLGSTTVRIGRANASVDANDFTLTDLAYSSDSSHLRAATTTYAGTAGEAQTEAVTVSGIDREAYLKDSTLRIDRVIVNALSGRIARKKDAGYYAVSTPVLELNSLEGKGSFRLGQLSTRAARMVNIDASGQQKMRATGVDLTQENIALPLEISSLGPTDLSIAFYRVFAPEEQLDYNFYGSRYVSQTGRLTLDSISRRNRLPSDRFHRERPENSWLDFGLQDVAITGINRSQIAEGESIALDSLTANGFQLEVVEDVSKGPSDKIKPMPIEALRRIGPRIVVRGTRITETAISYGVLDSLLEPKTIRFERGIITADRMDTRVERTDSTLIAIETTFEGNTPVYAEFSLHHGTSGRDFGIKGEMGFYDLGTVNPLMQIAAGAMIETGEINRLRYTGTVRADTLTGTMDFLYENLNIKPVGSGAWLKNLAENLIVKNDNQTGEDFRPGKMYHVHTPERSFFNAYWKGLVSGMMSSALSDIVLKDELE